MKHNRGTNDFGDVKKKYEILEILGSGAYGTVRKCRNKENNELFAIKTIHKRNVKDVKVLLREISILASMDHPHIIKLFDVYEDTSNIHLITELCTGGELYDRVVEKAESDEGHFHEDDAAILIRDILDGIAYCHDVAKIVHRDLKPENFLLKHKGDDAPIKIIDFGLSRRDDADFGIMSSRVGTPYYVAPEVLKESYNYKCDIWSIGIIAYILLCGFAPFSGDNDMETLYLVENAALEFPSPEWDDISDEAKDFITQLLHRDAYLRPTASQAMEHPWIAKHIVEPGIPKPRPFRNSTDSMNMYSASSNSSSELRMNSHRRSAFHKFLVSLKVKKVVFGGILGSPFGTRSTSNSSNSEHQLSPTEMEALSEVFRKVDKDKDGMIAVEDVDRAVASENNAFSSSLKRNLQEIRSTLATYPKMRINIRPFLKLIEQSGTVPQSSSTGSRSSSTRTKTV